MAAYNKVLMAGNLTRDPEVKYIPGRADGEPKAILDFCIAVNQKWKGEEETLFMECTAFGNTAESTAQFCTKGRELLVEGRLKLEKWTNKAGEDRQRMKIVCSGVYFFGAKQRERSHDRGTEEDLDF